MSISNLINTSRLLLVRNKRDLLFFLAIPLVLLIFSSLVLDSFNPSFDVAFNGRIADPLTDSFLKTLNERSIILHPVIDSVECRQSVKHGRVIACLDFNYSAYSVSVYLDNSNPAVSMALENLLKASASEISSDSSLSYASDFKSRLLMAQSEINNTKQSLTTFVTQQDSLSKKLDSTRLKLADLDFTIDLSKPAALQDSLNKNKILLLSDTIGGFKGKIDNQFRESIDAIETAIKSSAISDSDRSKILLLLSESKDNLYEVTSQFEAVGKLTEDDIGELRAAIDTLQADLTGVSEQLSALSATTDKADLDIASVQKEIKSNIASLLAIQKSLNLIYESGNQRSFSQSAIPLSVIKLNKGTLFSGYFPAITVIILFCLGLFLSIHLSFSHKGHAHIRNLMTPHASFDITISVFLLVTFLLLIESLVFLIFALLFFSHSIFAVFYSIPFMILSSIFPVVLGILISHLSLKESYSYLYSNLILFVMVLFSSVSVSSSSIITSISWLIDYNPFSLLVDGLRRSLIFNLPTDFQLASISILLIEFVVLVIPVFILDLKKRSI